jgi:hypothetical protein
MASLIVDIYTKFQNGDALTDNELDIGITHFTKMGDDLIKSGPVFRLAASEAIRVSQRLGDFRNARSRK